jgi:hypothetical protein
MFVGLSQLWKKYYCAASLKQMINFNLLLTLTSDINGVLFALFSPVFFPYIRFITFITAKICLFQYKLEIRPVFELNKICEGK